MICDSFALSSSVESAPVTAEIATALLERLRQVEHPDMWGAFLTAPEETAYGKQNPSRLLALVQNAEAWGRLANVGFHWTVEVGEIPAAPNACRIELLADFKAFPGVPADFEAFHTVDSLGRQVCYLSLAACGADWPSAAAHEMAEARVNAMLQAKAAAPDGTDWDLEVCDPVEGSDSAPPGTTVKLANVCGPRFFMMTEEGALDLSGLAGPVAGSFQELATGYHQGSAGTVYGERMREAKRKHLAAGGGRTALREAA